MNRNSHKLTVGQSLRLIKTAYLNPTVKPKSFILVGESGIGKTEGIEQIANELNIGYYNIRTPEIDPTDLLGVWDTSTGYYKTPILPKEGELAIILMDEINRGQIPTMQACMRIMEGRGTTSFKYDHEKQMVVAAANPVTDDDVVEILGRALINRPYIVFVEPDLFEWVEWINGNITEIKAKKEDKETLEKLVKEWQKKIAMFLLAFPKYFIKQGTPEMAARFEGVPNPRNWIEASKIIVLFDVAELDKSISARIGTKVGFEAASDFEAFLKDPEPPVTGSQVLDDYPKYKKTFIKHQKESMEKAIATIHDLAITLNSKEKLSDKEMRNIKEFLNSIDINKEELAMSLFNRLNNKVFDKLFFEIPEFFDRNLKIINEIKEKFNKK